VIYSGLQTSAALAGLGNSFLRFTQGVARQLALPWAIIFRACSPLELPSRPKSDLLNSPQKKIRALKAGGAVD
jgi:hypothetical protein